MAENKPLSPTARLFVGLFCIAAGVLPILAAFDIGPLHSRDINGPPWLGAAAGGVFLLAGIALLLGDAARKPPLTWVSSTIAVLIFAAFAALGNWIAFGPGSRQCSGGFSTFLFSSTRAAAEWECRAAFGIGACVLNGLLVWMLARGLGRLAGPGRLADGLEKLGKGALLIGLSPILVPLLAFVVGKSALEAFLEYHRTGRWPRNEAFIARMRRRKPGD